MQTFHFCVHVDRRRKMTAATTVRLKTPLTSADGNHTIVKKKSAQSAAFTSHDNHTTLAAESMQHAIICTETNILHLLPFIDYTKQHV